MKRSIDLQSSHHNTRPEYLSTKIEVAIKKDNELYREVKLAIQSMSTVRCRQTLLCKD